MLSTQLSSYFGTLPKLNQLKANLLRFQGVDDSSAEVPETPEGQTDRFDTQPQEIQPAPAHSSRYKPTPMPDTANMTAQERQVAEFVHLLSQVYAKTLNRLIADKGFRPDPDTQLRPLWHRLTTSSIDMHTALERYPTQEEVTRVCNVIVSNFANNILQVLLKDLCSQQDSLLSQMYGLQYRQQHPLQELAPGVKGYMLDFKAHAVELVPKAKEILDLEASVEGQYLSADRTTELLTQLVRQSFLEKYGFTDQTDPMS